MRTTAIGRYALSVTIFTWRLDVRNVVAKCGLLVEQCICEKKGNILTNVS